MPHAHKIGLASWELMLAARDVYKTKTQDHTD